MWVHAGMAGGCWPGCRQPSPPRWCPCGAAYCRCAQIALDLSAALQLLQRGDVDSIMQASMQVSLEGQVMQMLMDSTGEHLATISSVLDLGDRLVLGSLGGSYLGTIPT